MFLLPRAVTKFGSLIKFSHSVFALPFALSMLCVVSRTEEISRSQLIWIVLSVVMARAAAMGWNRLLDAEIDAQNPRTASREIPSGKVTKGAAWALVVICALLFLFFAGLLGNHCLVLAPLVLGVLFLYSWTKRFTFFSHGVLGLCLALAPGGVWYALTAQFAVLPLFLMGAVALWVAGFDIIYACQDADFDRSVGLFSIPARVGIKAALRIARVLHTGTVLSLIVFAWSGGLGIFSYVGTALFSALLVSLHVIVSEHDLSRINAAFFTRNAWASVVYFVFVCIDCLGSLV